VVAVAAGMAVETVAVVEMEEAEVVPAVAVVAEMEAVVPAVAVVAVEDALKVVATEDSNP